MNKQTKLLIILDGWGESKKHQHNAIVQAKTPTIDMFKSTYAHTLIHTSGGNVGLPGMQMGNSEVGHLNLGAGRVVKQEFTRISDDISSGDFFNNPIFKNALNYANDNNKSVHILGLISDGGVHAHIDHILAMLTMVKKYNCHQVYIHIFTDGRDCAPKSAKKYISLLEDKISQLGIGRIASIIGRYYAMDRDNRWNRTRHAYDLLHNCRGRFCADNASGAVDMAYERGELDEFISATTIDKAACIKKGDVMISMNYRADRIRQLTQAFIDEDFQGFSRGIFTPVQFVCLTEYKKSFNLPVAYPTQKLNNVLGKYISNLGLTQLRIAETEKYAHVTFFLNGGVEKPFNGEDRILIPSPDVPTYDCQPQMSAYELTDELVKAIKSNKYDLIICNYANTDMVGHSGKLDAAISAVEAVDNCLAKVYEVAKNTQAEMIITADHGNAEMMFNEKTSEPHTAHTNNLVPLIFVGRKAKLADIGSGSLSDIAPSLLTLMGLEIPTEMTGKPLIKLD